MGVPGIASATGLLSARIRPIRRPKPKVMIKSMAILAKARRAPHARSASFTSALLFIYSKITCIYTQSVELSGCARAAPFALRPFAGLFNPYPYGCSVLCNHPADCEAKEVVRRAKDTWVKEIHPSYVREDDRCDPVKDVCRVKKSKNSLAH